MSGHHADFSGDIPLNYDRGLGPVLFVDYAADIARRAVSGATPLQVLEAAAGSGIVTRALRDALPANAHLTATDLNPDMLAIAREKFTSDEAVEFQQADATALPFADGSFDTWSASLASCSIQTRTRAIGRRIASSRGTDGICSASGIRIATMPSAA